MTYRDAVIGGAPSMPSGHSRQPLFRCLDCAWTSNYPTQAVLHASNEGHQPMFKSRPYPAPAFGEADLALGKE